MKIKTLLLCITILSDFRQLSCNQIITIHESKITKLEILTQRFLTFLNQDEYLIITHQPDLIEHFQKLISCIDKIDIKNVAPSSALLFAQAFSKMGNLSRRMETPAH